jgi:hypothetical protein
VRGKVRERRREGGRGDRHGERGREGAGWKNQRGMRGEEERGEKCGRESRRRGHWGRGEEEGIEE